MKSILLTILMVLAATHLKAGLVMESSEIGEGEGTQFSMTQTVGVADTVLVVGVAMTAENEGFVDSITYDGSNLTYIIDAQMENEVRQEVWYLYDPVTYTATLQVNLTSTAKVTIGSVAFSGVSHTGQVYFSTSGMGKNVSSIPMNISTVAGSDIIGFGIAQGDAQAITVTGQTVAWNILNISEPEFRSMGIVSPFPFSAWPFLVRNYLNKPADWSICVIGIQAAD